MLSKLLRGIGNDGSQNVPNLFVDITHTNAEQIFDAQCPTGWWFVEAMSAYQPQRLHC